MCPVDVGGKLGTPKSRCNKGGEPGHAGVEPEGFPYKGPHQGAPFCGPTLSQLQQGELERDVERFRVAVGFQSRARPPHVVQQERGCPAGLESKERLLGGHAWATGFFPPKSASQPAWYAFVFTRAGPLCSPASPLIRGSIKGVTPK